MTVRAKTGRTRYVVFRIVQGAPVPRGAWAAVLPEGARLTRYDGEWGIVRTTHDRRDALVERLHAVEHLGGRPVRVETVISSGTILAASRAVPSSSPVSRRSPPGPSGTLK